MNSSNSPTNIGVIDRTIRKPVVNFIYKVRNVINAFGMIVGAISLSLVDVILGGFVLSNLLANSIEFDFLWFSVSGVAVGWMLSIVFWFIQLTLWDYILDDGKLTKQDVPALVLAVLIALIDTFGDASAILIGTMNSNLEAPLSGIEFFGYNLFEVLVGTLFIATMIICGMNEFLNRLLVRNATVTFKLPEKKVSHQGTPTNKFFQSPNPNNYEKLVRKFENRTKARTK